MKQRFRFVQRVSRRVLGGLALAAALWVPACGSPRSGAQVTQPEEREPVRCDPLELARAPGGALEVEPGWLHAHAHCGLRIVDVRERAELEGELGRIEGAEWAPLSTLEAYAATWRTDETIVIVDRSGRRAVRAQEVLATLGMHRVASLTGGMLAWHAAGLPVTRGPFEETPPPEASSAPRAQGDPVAARLADATHIQWVGVASILGAGAQQCIDGRAEGPVVGTPGGDAGELALALSALEHGARREVPIETVAPALAAYAQGFGRFYMHSDTHALDALGEALRADPRFASARDAGLLDERAVERFVRRPPPALEDALLEQLVRPEHVGCGHLRTMLQHPSEYGARRELVEAVIREAYRLGWSHPELLSFEVLEGEHEERAVVRVWLDHPVHAYTRVPTFPAQPGERTAFFVAHPEVSAYLRRELASFLVESAPGLGLRAPTASAYQHELDALAERQVAATLRHLARELPVYDVHMRDGAPVVSGPNGSSGCRDY